MKRRLFNLAALVSLLIGVAVAGLWVRGTWWTTDTLVISAGGGQVTIRTGAGAIEIKGVDEIPREYQWVGWTSFPLPPDATKWSPEFSSTGGSRVVIPDWLLIVLCLLLPVWWAVHRYRHRPLPGHCVKCGYDLRASKDACPECGAAIPVKAD